jgi:hypothetical protein
MAEKYYGLCETCEHDATCMLRRSSILKIIQCEEFSIRPMENRPVPASDQSGFQDPAETARLGICGNCLNVLSCGFPNARCGVQQCEEYILDEAGVVPPLQSEYSRSAA